MLERDKFYFRVLCVIFWMMGVGPFVIEEILPGNFDVQIISLLSDALMVLLGLVTLRNRTDIFYIFIFLFISIFSSIWNQIPTLLWINGLRDYIPFILGLPVLRYFMTCRDSEEYRLSFDRQLRLFLIVQAFCVTEQFLKYGAGDHGGGSLGNFHSGTISICIIFISFYFVCKDWDGDNYMKSLWRNRLYIFLLFPVFLNETKVSFVLLFVYFLLLYSFTLRNTLKLVIALPLVLLVAIGLIYAYSWSTNSKYDFLDQEFLNEYLSGGENADEILEVAEIAIDFVEEATDTWDENDWAYIDIPRLLKLPLLWKALDDSKGGYLLGAGMGHLKGGTSFQRTDFYLNHVPLIYGTRMSIHLFIMPMGLLGLIWVILWYKHSLKFRTRVGPMAMRIKLFLLFVVVMNFFYQETFRFMIPCLVFYYMSLTTQYPLKEEGSEPEQIAA